MQRVTLSALPRLRVIYYGAEDGRRGVGQTSRPISAVECRSPTICVRDITRPSGAPAHDFQHGENQTARRTGKLDEQEKELLEYVIKAADRMEALIRDLLKYSRTVNLEGRPSVEAKEAVEWACNNLQEAIAESNASIQVDDLPVVKVDMISLVQVFQNLVSNALKYRGAESPSSGILAAPENTEWVFSVVDNGASVSLPRITIEYLVS